MSARVMICVVVAVLIVAVSVPALGGGVRVLLYHAIDTYGMLPALFTEEMDFLSVKKYHPITLDALMDWLSNGATLPYRPIVLTFDDNYISVYTQVYPILQARGFVATSFAHTDYVGVAPPGPPPTSFDHADWNEIQEMENAGVVSTQSHTKTHRYLTQLSQSDAWAEIYESKLAIETHLSNKTCKYLAYPYGDYDQSIISLVQAAGYDAAFTTVVGENTPPTPHYELYRTSIAYTETLSSFKTKIGYYEIPDDMGYVLDNLDANCVTTGTWASSSAIAGYWHQNYLYHDQATGDAEACWGVLVPEAGGYKINARWTSDSGRATNARYTVVCSSGSTAIVLDQTQNGGQWNLLGTYSLQKGEALRVYLSGNANGFVVADAIQLMPATSRVAHWLFY